MKLFSYRLASLISLTSNHVQVKIYPQDEIMTYKAGQYIIIEYPDHSFLPFSIANTPRSDNEIELHIRISLQDKATMQFINTLKRHKQLKIAGPYGDCYYKNNDNSLFIIAAGTGFAPAKAIIENMCETKPEQECHLYWTVRRLEDLYLAALPTFWQKSCPHFHFTSICTGGSERGQLFELIKGKGKLDQASVYVFGPPNLAMDTLKELIPYGLKKDNFYADVLSRDQIFQQFSLKFSS